MNVIGYADALSVRQGESISFMVSCSEPAFRADVVRLDRAFAVAAPDRDRIVETPVNGEYPGRVQAVPIGSYLAVDGDLGLERVQGLAIHCWVQPGLCPASGAQGLVACWDEPAGRGFWLGLDAAGRVALCAGASAGLSSTAVVAEPLSAGRWYAIAASIDPARAELRLHVIACRRSWLPAAHARASAQLAGWDGVGDGPLLLGASFLETIGGGRTAPRQCYNGKLDRPRLWGRPLTEAEEAGLTDREGPESEVGLVAAWDPGRQTGSRIVPDRSPHGLHAVAFNSPTRGVVGANWDGSSVSYLAGSEHHGAIAFHEDDLEDCAWQPAFTFEVPLGQPAGVYAARLQAGGTFDYVPFVVRPAADSPGDARVAVLLPTNTYLAYGNDKLFRGIDGDPEFVAKATDHDIELTDRERFLDAHPELGSSVYDTHPDGSGICFSTRLRPVLTMRPESLAWLTGCPRHFAADLYLVEWLEREGVAYEVLTDEDLHREGRAALEPYRVVLTGGHPEYWTSTMLDGLEGYLAGGGRLMYLGGNGFYWVTGIAQEAPHLIEVRRGINGTRSWTSHPGEVTLTTTAEPGGLWRYRGRPPNALVGVGFASEGWGGAPGYARLPDAADPRAAWVFDGVEEDVIGDFGLIMGGAAGDEVDRYDLALGTPPETLRLATSEGRHSDYYQLVIEDVGLMLPGRGGTEDRRVRADLTLLESPDGGAVFSTGSINWIGSLLTDGGANNVSQVTRNVLRRFAELD